MINKTRTTLVVFTLMAVAALAATLAAQAPGGRGRGQMGPGFGGPDRCRCCNASTSPMHRRNRSRP